MKSSFMCSEHSSIQRIRQKSFLTNEFNVDENKKSLFHQFDKSWTCDFA